MGKHRKIRGVPRHAKTSSHPVAKKVATFGAAAATVPTLALTFSGSAHAATMSEWNAVSIPEAGGDWCIDHSSDGLSVGGLQFQNPSWHDALSYLNSRGIDTSQWAQNLTQFMGRSNVPSKNQQILAGEALLHIQGPGAWANGNASGVEASMFDGGPNPFGLLGTAIPDGILLHGSCTAGEPGPAPVPTPTPPPPPVPTPTPVPVPSHHWRHHGWHHGWKHHHRPVPVPPSPVVPPTPPTPPTPPPPVAPAACDHIVVPGDTVSQVAAANGAPLAQVEAVNPGIIAGSRPDDFSLIFAGGHIHMPAGFCDGNQ